MAAPAETRRAFVPCDDEQAPGEGSAPGDPRNEGAEEGVALGDRPVVHVVRQVRDDELEVRRGRAETGEVGDPTAPRGIARDVREADRGLVRANVRARRSDEVDATRGGRAEVAPARQVL